MCLRVSHLRLPTKVVAKHRRRLLGPWSNPTRQFASLVKSQAGQSEASVYDERSYSRCEISQSGFAEFGYTRIFIRKEQLVNIESGRNNIHLKLHFLFFASSPLTSSLLV